MQNQEIPFSPQLIGSLLDIIHNAILIIDSRHRIVFANHRTAKMFETSVHKLQQSDIALLFMPDDQETMFPNILEITRQTGEFEGEVMLRRPDGRTFLGLLAATFFHWAGGEEGMAITIHDISDIKALEQSLVRSERVAFLGRLVDDISHQIRNPVMVIGGFSKRLSSECGGSEPAQAIIKEANYLEGLLNTLNAFIRLPPPNLMRVRMHELFALLEKELGAKVHFHGGKWISSYEPGLEQETLLMDQSLLLEALEAIAVNACEAYDRKAVDKKVTCEVARSEDPVHPFQIRISDRGNGFAEDQAHHAFSPFYSTKTKHIGMGLTIARRIVEEQMGTISLESTAGKGTTVVCHLIKERRRAIRLGRIP
jgi:PAS domain S-box-containing protein